MTEYLGAARTNYVKVADLPGLEKVLEAHDLELLVATGITPDDRNYYAIVSISEGGWPSRYCIDPDVEEEVDFEFETHIMPFIEEGEVLVIVEAGDEKMRYLVGEAAAFVRIGKEVKEVCVSLGSIYDLAASEFAIERNQITPAEY